MTTQYPLQATVWVESLESLDSWVKFYQEKKIRYKISTKRNKKGEMRHAIFRTLTRKEKKLVEKKEYKIRDNFLQAANRVYTSPRDGEVVTFNCINCGAVDSGRGKSGKNLCQNCLLLVDRYEYPEMS